MMLVLVDDAGVDDAGVDDAGVDDAAAASRTCGRLVVVSMK